MTREEKAWRSLCGGKPAPRSKPDPAPAPTPVTRPEPYELHPERLTDPRWQMRPWRKGGRLAFLKRYGMLDEAKLQAHYDLVNRQAMISSDRTKAPREGTETGSRVGAAISGLAPRVGTAVYRSTPNRPVSAQPLGGP